jgi:NAD(P)-dependent dehydrogenase (short-subunit alcohol dehydrogenase family)
MAQLDGRSIIITGAAGGIGSATAVVLAEAGARLILTDLAGAGEDVAASIAATGGEARFVPADIATEEGVEKVVAAAIDAYGALDGAFNNAGIANLFKPIEELELAEVERTLRINVLSVFLCMKHQIRAMDRGGSIVNTASAMGQVAMPRAAEYVASKHAVIGFTRAAAVDCAARKIRVNAVLPGVIKTPMVQTLLADPETVPVVERLQAAHILNRLGEAHEISGAVKWLLSDEASFVTGSAVAVDGGYAAI